ncbi:hypothetical protein FA592_06520 [Sulfurospirillum diekertiae]|uniref:Uncharacterized protein n=1 Tax=Sulfurospirillum diekertiae TaxID=1854492 RepID=A0A6G9VSF6_9BACT|nr:hypothetical protein [Sulfurospirillum diekertiae]QIR75903.1 hypothetical protein FA584_06650 [Sulfurospirillum diekertiae]QIR78543.1 hypothetical protein FA592_06520 [Sulfurospirillum diekertiae]
MFDIATISTALGSVKTAIDITKLLKESSGTLQKAEVDLKLAELISSLADLKMKMADIKDALIESENEKKELKAKLELQAKLQFEMPYYWSIEEDGKKDGPFCQLCYDKEKKLIRLQDGNNGEWSCLACRGYFRDKNYVEPIYSTTSDSGWN